VIFVLYVSNYRALYFKNYQKSKGSSTEIKSLNAFYAIEWTLFAGFAVFLWWRMVQDERLGLRAER
jgi:hypothetical protein